MGKKNKRWLWTAVNHWQPGILAWVLGDRSSQTFKPLWKLIRGWQSFFYVTRTHPRSVPCSARSGALAPRWTVYPCFINDAEAPLPSRRRRRTARMRCTI